MATTSESLRRQRKQLLAGLHLSRQEGRRVYRRLASGDGRIDPERIALAETYLLVDEDRFPTLKALTWLQVGIALPLTALGVLLVRAGDMAGRAPEFVVVLAGYAVGTGARLLSLWHLRRKMAAARAALDRSRGWGQSLTPTARR